MIAFDRDEKYMARCLEIAKNGLGSVAPNPMVGAVIVRGDKIIGEGYTSPYGGPHAEVNAIAAVSDKTLLSKSTLYVTLEPCSHFGKTPPCADLITSHGIPKVVIGIGDPNDKVAGKGIAKLRAAGCTIKSGVLEEACRRHHKRFLTFHEQKRPYIILKWAETQDGFIAPPKEQRSKVAAPVWISNVRSRQLVHQWRAQEQAILIGANTALHDNPKLSVRHWTGPDPIRVLLDKDLSVTGDLHILDGNAPIWIFTEKHPSVPPQTNVSYHKIDFGQHIIARLCTELHNESVSSILIEGGGKTLQHFIDSGYWDEARVFIGNKMFGAGIKAPKFKSIPRKTIALGNTTLNYFYNA